MKAACYPEHDAVAKSMAEKVADNFSKYDSLHRRILLIQLSNRQCSQKTDR